MKLVSNIVPEKELREAQLRALKLFCEAVRPTYGPMGGYTAYSKKSPGKNLEAIIANYTKDGFTVLKDVQVDKPIESLLKDEIRTICTQVIKVIGDGTTSATMLSYYMFKGLLDLQNKGYGKREVIRVFKDIISEGITRIEKAGHECTLDDIYNIAFTSLDGNEKMANTIKGIYEQSGMDVYIDVSVSNSSDTVIKTYNSMIYEAGYISSAFINNAKDNTCELQFAHVYVFENAIDTPAMIGTLKMIVDKELIEPMTKYRDAQEKGKNTDHIVFNPVIVICPKISRDANAYLDALINEFTQVKPEQRYRFCIVANIDNDNQYLMDIMRLTGAKFIKGYIDPNTYNNDKVANLAPTEKNILTFAGEAEKIIVDSISTRIINPKNMYDKNGQYTEFYKQYIAELEDTLKKYEETREELVKISNLKRRINILKANMVDLYVGGIGMSDRDVLRDSVEDAVLNCRSAAIEGVGYGANYEGFRAFSDIDTEIRENLNKLKDDDNTKESDVKEADLYSKVSYIILDAYSDLVAAIYEPYFDGDKKKAYSLALVTLKNEDRDKRKPYNILTEEFDDKVLTSIKTEPAILDSISRIITLLFNTNQFLVPDPRFNIYTMDSEEKTIVVRDVKEKLESVPISEINPNVKEEDISVDKLK